MQNSPICLRSAGVLFVFGVVYHPKKNNRLERLKMENNKIAPDFTTKSDLSFCHIVDETQTQGKRVKTPQR